MSKYEKEQSKLKNTMIKNTHDLKIQPNYRNGTLPQYSDLLWLSLL